MVGTFWISGKGGILEKGVGVDLEKGGMNPPPLTNYADSTSLFKKTFNTKKLNLSSNYLKGNRVIPLGLALLYRYYPLTLENILVYSL